MAADTPMMTGVVGSGATATCFIPVSISATIPCFTNAVMAATVGLVSLGSLESSWLESDCFVGRGARPPSDGLSAIRFH